MWGGGGGPPIVPGVQIGDLAGGALMAAVGILTALVARTETGRGQFVDVSMTDGSLAVNVTHALWAFAKKRQPPRGGTQLTGRHPCYAVYETKDGKHVTVGAIEPHFWRNLCERLGFGEYAEHQHAEGELREEMFRRFRAKFRERTREEWVAELRPLDICFGPVLDFDEVERDPQIVHRKMMPTIDDPRKGPLKTIGPPIKLSETPATIRTPPARFGEHTAEVLGEVGIGAAELEDLRRAAVV
jgi:crotonobetainyl-CoA:carnitine CoA-transferase CaiB-like acyl-CoA transferase